MKKLLLGLCLLVSSGAWAISTGGGGSSSFTPYGAGNPPPVSNFPVMSNGASLIGYWPADEITGIANGGNLPNTSLIQDLTGLSGPMSVNVSTCNIDYHTNQLGGHATFRLPGNPTGNLILPTANGAGATIVDTNTSWFVVMRDCFQGQSVGSAAPIALGFGITGSGFQYGMAVSQAMGETFMKTGSAFINYNQLFWPSDFCLMGFSTAQSITTCYIDGLNQAVTNQLGSSPVTCAGMYVGSGVGGGQWDGMDVIAILRYSGAVTETPGGVGYDDLKEIISSPTLGFGVNTASRSNIVGFHGDSVSRGYAGNSNGTGNGLSPANWLAHFLDKSWAVYNFSWDGALTTDLINSDASAFATLLNSNKWNEKVIFEQAGNNDFNSNGSTAATVENNLLAMAQQDLNNGFSEALVSTILSGGYTGVTETARTTTNTWITGTLPGLFSNIGVVDVNSNKAVTTTFFAQPHITNAAMIAYAQQMAATIGGLAPQTFPGFNGNITLTSGAASVTLQGAFLTTSMKFSMVQTVVSGTSAGAAITVNSSALSILNATGAATDNGTYHWQRIL